MRVVPAPAVEVLLDDELAVAHHQQRMQGCRLTLQNRLYRRRNGSRLLAR